MSWDKNTELVSLHIYLTPEADLSLPANYTYGLLGWWLDRIRQDNPELSAYLHDGGSEKPFTLSALSGVPATAPIRLIQGKPYQWIISALYQPLCQWLATWLTKLAKTPEIIKFPRGNLIITKAEIALPPTTYQQLWQTSLPQQRSFSLNFTTPTSFRSKKHHLPLPIPQNVFHSYLRRWNDFSGYKHDQEEFLAWVAETVFVSGHDIATTKIQAGKKGTVTGFTGWVSFGVDAQGNHYPDQQQLLYALLQLAPYCGTGHKTTFGLGQTQLGIDSAPIPQITKITKPVIPKADQSSNELSHDSDGCSDHSYGCRNRITELTNLFFQQKKRQGGTRAQDSAKIWATILARYEFGESLQAIAIDLQMPYETVKTYAKLARRAINNSS